MREIEFRGKSIMEGTEGRWLSSFGIKYGDDIELLYCDEETSDTWYYVDKETIGQYTGLKDKNGKKIFEGDIVKINNDVAKMFCIEPVISVVKYFFGTFICTNKDNYTNIGRSLIALTDINGVFRGEVIGNIYDNPELLKEK